ncbi:TauD/TfdA family dioxygenase [Psychrobacter sp. H7-1]|uniref:TauD/TfdA family dioxygenase n=1 Tax=Psychrobacter sp. H7-1 TaxID=1569265 RepID=UPI001D10145A|nr:TauD/TfdA family dioxygenase [Psychrobacter sp. H7-1]
MKIRSPLLVLISGSNYECSTRPNEFGTLVIKNLPFDPVLPNTPNDGRRPYNKLPFSEAVLALIGCLAGDIFSYRDEKEGLLIQNICPIQGQEYRQENTGSMFLEFHTEDSFHPLPPDILMLSCLRGDRTKKAITCTACIDQIIPLLKEETLNKLLESVFTIKSSSSFKNTKYTKQTPIVYKEEGKYYLVFDPSAMMASDKESEVLLQTVYNLLRENTYGICLEPNEAIIIDNRKACHARTGFVPFFDGYDRWLQRIFLTKNLDKYEDFFVQGTRVVDNRKLQRS